MAGRVAPAPGSGPVPRVPVPSPAGKPRIPRARGRLLGARDTPCVGPGRDGVAGRGRDRAMG